MILLLVLKISNAEAEKIKRQYELALTSLIKNDQEISVFDINENKKKNVKVSEVVEIIEARVYEIFSLCRNQVVKAGAFQQPGRRRGINRRRYFICGWEQTAGSRSI